MAVGALIFDLDGTLIDSAPDIHACLNQSLSQHGFGQVRLAQTKSFIGRGVSALVSQALEALTIPHDERLVEKIVTGLTRLYETEIGHSQLYPNVREALIARQRQGDRLGICTNRPGAATLAMLDHFDLTQHFDAFAYGDGPYPRKPDPAPLRHVVAKLGAEHAVYVGDSETDAATARAAKLPFVLFTEGYRKTPIEDLPHDANFRDFADLTGAVTRIISQ